MKITKITKLQPGIYAYVCPLCGEIYASASEPEYLPEYSICSCDLNENKQPIYELFERNGKKMIRRNKFPRFIGEITFGQLSDIENIEMLDECTNPSEFAKAMRSAGEFLIKSSKNGKTS